MTDLCQRCGRSTAPGSGLFVDRITHGDPLAWVCRECGAGRSLPDDVLGVVPYLGDFWGETYCRGCAEDHAAGLCGCCAWWSLSEAEPIREGDPLAGSECVVCSDLVGVVS